MWHNKDLGGNERYYPDFNHLAHGGKKHYDYTDKNGKKWRMYEDGTVEPKNGHMPDAKTENGE